MVFCTRDFGTFERLNFSNGKILNLSRLISHIFRCHFHQHHLFWKQPFLPCSARRLLLARRLLRYEDMTSVHISVNITHSGCKPGRLRESVNVDMKLPGLQWMGNVQGYVHRYFKKFMVRRRNSTSTEEVARFQPFFLTRADWRQEEHPVTKKTHFSIPMDRHLFMVTK